ncbi:transcriptional regulator, putative [Babesia ovis]|uniref:Transcriptional regulator, putative n=1 Tax=Babesia ovis TaxID=5869 RepID=A0A9W5WVI8_BABOV|nr:transcriptional regulator, putative [Babesia ovis]
MAGLTDVHVLPCLIKETGPADIKRGFTDRIFVLNSSDTSNGEPESHTRTALGQFTLRDICGTIADDVSFDITPTEFLDQDVYYSQHGTDPLLSKERLCTFLRGRCLRGSSLELSRIGYRMSIVEPSASLGQSAFTKHPSVTSYTIQETTAINSLTLWDRDRDISPLSPFLEGYKHLYVASSLCDYSGELDYIQSCTK